MNAAERIGHRAPVALVVDDADDIRLLMRRALEVAGYEVVTARSGAEGLAVAGSIRPDLIVLDVQMPEMDGWEALAALRSHPDPVVGSVPITMCTVKSAGADRAKGWALGCDGYVTKPFSVAELLDLVVDITHRSPEERVQKRTNELANALRD